MRLKAHILIDVISFCLMLSGVVCCILFLVYSRANQPNSIGFQIDPTTLDLGTVDQQFRSDYPIQVTNHTADEIKVESISSGCNCKDVKITPATIAPGEKQKLSFSFFTGRKRNTISETYQISYRTNLSPTLKTKELMIVANVAPQYSVMPDTVRINRGESSHEVRLISHHPGDNFRIRYATSNSNDIHTTVSKNGDSITVSYENNSKQDASSASSKYLFVHVDVPDRDVLVVPLILPLLEVQP